MENIVILGDGIAGLTAAIYNARADMDPLVITGPESGGQLTYTTDVENFPGFPEGVQGPGLIQRSRKQAERFGARYKTGQVTDMEKEGDTIRLFLESGEEINTKAAILATGASARWLGLENEEKYQGNGVSTCATCDGFFYKDKDVIVVGGGDSAMEESTFLTKFASSVTVVHRRDELRASQIMQDRFFDNEKTSILWDTEVIEYHGEDTLEAVTLRNNETGEEWKKEIDGVFLAIGHDPNTSFAKDLVELDENEYLIVDERGRTNVEGVFGAGDVHDVLYRQAVTAAGAGCRAALEAERYVNELDHN